MSIDRWMSQDAHLLGFAPIREETTREVTNHHPWWRVFDLVPYSFWRNVQKGVITMRDLCKSWFSEGTFHEDNFLLSPFFLLVWSLNFAQKCVCNTITCSNTERERERETHTHTHTHINTNVLWRERNSSLFRVAIVSKVYVTTPTYYTKSFRVSECIQSQKWETKTLVSCFLSLNPKIILAHFWFLCPWFCGYKLRLPNVLDHEKKESLLGTCDEQQFYYRPIKVASPIRRKVVIHLPI